MPQANIFVSYSHTDGHLVKPVVEILRITEAFVFLDIDTLRHGKRWRDQVQGAIDSASTVVVFWCHHSSESEEVANEISFGLARGKDFLPILLDGTPPPPALAEFQYVDLRKVVLHAAPIRPSRPTRLPPSTSPPRPKRAKTVRTFAQKIALLAALIILGSFGIVAAWVHLPRFMLWILGAVIVVPVLIIYSWLVLKSPTVQRQSHQRTENLRNIEESHCSPTRYSESPAVRHDLHKAAQIIGAALRATTRSHE